MIQQLEAMFMVITMASFEIKQVIKIEFINSIKELLEMATLATVNLAFKCSRISCLCFPKDFDYQCYHHHYLFPY
jgi:hypothetical protein